jgi:SAM-dependent methyltransferase
MTGTTSRLTHTAPETINPLGERLEDFYSSAKLPEEPSAAEESLYQIWERCGAYGDSVTPSTYCPQYREHLVAKILEIARPGARLLSLGCGNAFVEARLVETGLDVTGIDCNEEAVGLAACKGVKAFNADYLELPPAFLTDFDIIYADGFLGHMYDPAAELSAFFEQLARLTPSAACAMVFSNDAPLDPRNWIEPHATAPNFWMLSRGFLTDAMRQWDYAAEESYYFSYRRPISGWRDRTIVISRTRI